MSEVDTQIPAGTQNIADSFAKTLEAKVEKVEETPTQSLATDTKEKVAEPEKETPVVKLEATKEVEANKEFEELASYFDEEVKDEKTTEAEGKKPETTKEEKDYTEFINKAKEYDETMSIPLAKAVVELIKSGETDLNAIATKLGFENIDKKPSREVYENGLKAEGYTDEEIAIDMAEFDAIENKVKQDRLAKPYRDAQKAIQAENLKKFTEGLPRKAEADKAEIARFDQVKTAASKELETKVNALKGKKYEGLLNITEDMIPQIMQVAGQHATPIFDENNKITGYDLEGGIEAAILKLHKKQIIKAALTTGGTEAFLKWQKIRTAPKSNDHSTTAPVIERDIKDDVAEVVKQRTGRP